MTANFLNFYFKYIVAFSSLSFAIVFTVINRANDLTEYRKIHRLNIKCFFLVDIVLSVPVVVL